MRPNFLSTAADRIAALEAAMAGRSMIRRVRRTGNRNAPSIIIGEKAAVMIAAAVARPAAPIADSESRTAV
jgi:deoxyxylulose-5-phosphate synthase